MLARRVIVVSPETTFGTQLATALKAAGATVDRYEATEAIAKGDVNAALVVLHLEGALATAAAEILPRMTGEGKAIAVLPKSNVAAVVDIMQSSDRLSGLLVAEDLDTRDLTAMAARVMAGDIFGLEKLMSWGANIHSQLVGDYQEKSRCISEVSEFAGVMGVRRKYIDSIDQCLDEMLMNALYDAPVDEHGKPLFAEVSRSSRLTLRIEQKVVVQYACDGHRFALSVRDAFGTLERATVLRYLHKCLHASHQIDRKAGGAGLGLYLIANAASTVYFNVLPGIATEATCVFDLNAQKIQLRQFGFFTEKIDAAGRLAGGARRVSGVHPVERRRASEANAPSRVLIVGLSVAIGVVLVLILIVAWPSLFAR
jgi:hypothetical protein